MNKVILIGNLGDDPTTRQTTNSFVMNIRLATNERRKNGDTWKDHTEWHSIVVWGKQAEGLAQILRKGIKIGVEGRLQTREYEKDGVKRWSTEVVADDVEILTPKSQNAPPAQQQPAAPTGWTPQTAAPPAHPVPPPVLAPPQLPPPPPGWMYVMGSQGPILVQNAQVPPPVAAPAPPAQTWAPPAQGAPTPPQGAPPDPWGLTPQGAPPAADPFGGYQGGGQPGTG